MGLEPTQTVAVEGDQSHRVAGGASDDGLVVALDVGGTKTAAAVFDASWNQIAEDRSTTGTGGPGPVADSITASIKAVTARLDPGSITAVGIGVPGMVDPGQRTVRHAVNLGIGADPLDLAAPVLTLLGVEPVVANDVNAAAIGAHHLLNRSQDFAAPVESLAYLSIGTGIAAGIVLRGELHRGSSGVAGEIGHLPVMANGPMCPCGLSGCLEMVASGSTIERFWKDKSPGDLAMVSPAVSLMAAAKGGDAEAQAVLSEISRHLAHAVHLLAITYDVNVIVIGGGVADVGEPLVRIIREALALMGKASPFVESLNLPDRLRLAPEGSLGTVGAAVLARTAAVAARTEAP